MQAAITAHEIQRWYIDELDLTVDRIAPGITFSFMPDVRNAVESFNCVQIFRAKDGVAPASFAPGCGTRSNLYKKTFLPLAEKGYKHVVFAVGPVANELYAANKKSARKILVGIIR